MSRLVWGEPGKRLYETGVDRGVFYPQGGVGIPWNGLIAVSEAPSGADIRKSYYDGDSFRQQRTSESFAARIIAYTYPREFAEYDGLDLVGHKQQNRKMFNLSYRTKMANDLDSDASYLIHLVYNAVVTPSQSNYSSLGSNIPAIPFEWELNTVPEFLPDGEVSAHLVINPQIAYPWAVSALEDIIYGSATSDPRFPSIHEVIELFENASILRITDHGDGTWTADGPDEAIQIIYGPWVEKRRNLFRDPLAKTISDSSWGSTGGVKANVVDLDGTSWVRFTRQATGNVRLADIKAGVSLIRDTTYRFRFKIRSSQSRVLNLYARTAVTTSSENSILIGTIPVVSGQIHDVDVTATMPNSFESTLAGLTITHNGTFIGDTVDITEVNFENPTTVRPALVNGDAESTDFSRYFWSSNPDASISIYEEREKSFEITWPSAVYIDTDTYKISSL